MAKKKLSKNIEDIEVKALEIKARVSKKDYYQGAVVGGIIVAVIAIIIALI